MPDEPESSFVGVTSSEVGSSLRSILRAGEIEPGDTPSYQLCKTLYISHPLGAKMAESPIRLAQSVEREVTVSRSPEKAVVEAFGDEWRKLQATRVIMNVKTQARIYGLASVAIIEEGADSSQPVKLENLWKSNVTFNILDPLNTSGLIVNQDPNSPFFQKQNGDVTVQGKVYHRSRTCLTMNEESIYIAWTDSAFAYAGRSVYQRALFPLKSFVWTMIADEMVARKAGIIVARIVSPGSIVDRMMKYFAGVKRALLKQAETDNVLTIGVDESIESINLRNVNDAMQGSRENIIKNIATAADMPAKMLTQEAFVEGFGEGTEDAKAVAAYVDRIRIEMQELYDWFDVICMYRAWSPEFYETIQARFPEEYEGKDYNTAFYEWKNSFRAEWPSLLKEPPSEMAKVDDIRAQRVLNAVQVLAPLMDPENQAAVLEWAVDQLNSMENLLTGPQLRFDAEALTDHLEEAQDQQEQAGMMGGEQQEQKEENSAKPPKPTLGVDSATVASLAAVLAGRRGRAARYNRA